MRKLAYTLLFYLGLTGFAHAEAKLLQIESMCGPISVTQEFLDSQQELPFAGGLGAVRMSADEYAEGDWKIHVNPQTKSFSLMLVFLEDDIACLIGAGTGFMPLQQIVGNDT